MQFFRRVVFYIFAAVYVIACPLLLLYAYGYIYKPGAEKGVLATGAIYIDTAPTASEIYVDGKKYDLLAPAAIMELAPGEYSISLKLEGYKPWEETVPVEKEKATVLDKIILDPQKRETSEVFPEEVKELIPITGTSLLVARTGSALKEIKIYDYVQEKSWDLLPEGSEYLGYKFTSIFTQDESPHILVLAASESEGKYLWIKLQVQGNTVKEVSDLFLDKPQEIKWLSGEESDVFVMQGGNISKIDVAQGAIYPDIIRNAHGYGLFDGEVYVLDKNGTIIKTSYDAKPSATILDDKSLGEKIFGPSGDFRIEVLSSDIILFLGESGNLIANHLPYTFVDKGVEGIEFYQEEEKVLIWTKSSIGVLEFLKEETLNTSFEKGPSMRWIYTKGSNIKKAFWVYDASHVLFQDKEEVFLLGVEEFGLEGLDKIIGTGKGSTIYFSEETGEMYFSPEGAVGLFSTPIVPEKGPVPVVMPKDDNKDAKK